MSHVEGKGEASDRVRLTEDGLARDSASEPSRLSSRTASECRVLKTHPARLLPPRRCRGPRGRLRASRLPGGWTPVNVWPVRCDTRQLTEARCTEQTRNEREATVALRHCVRPLPVAGRSPHASLPCAWCSKDFGAFCHRDCPRGKRSNCRKCLVFLPLLREGKKKMQVKKSPSIVPRKAAKGPGNGPLRPGRP